MQTQANKDALTKLLATFDEQKTSAVAAAVAPLNEQIASLTAQLATAQGAADQADADDTQALVDANTKLVADGAQPQPVAVQEPAPVEQPVA